MAKGRVNAAFLDTIRTVIDMNILCGNALSMRLVDESQEDTDEPIIFSEWSLAMGDRVKRRDFRLDELLEGQRQQMSLFGLLALLRRNGNTTKALRHTFLCRFGNIL